MGYYNHEDFAFTYDGDFVMDTDPLDNGEDVGWDIMLASKFARNRRRDDMQLAGSHPNSDVATLKQFYMETLKKMYPSLADGELEKLIETWGYMPEDRFESLKQSVRDICKTTNQDWGTYPNVGANLEEQVGDSMTMVTAEALRQKIIDALTRDGLVQSPHLLVKYFIADEKTLLFAVEVLTGVRMVIREIIPFSFVEGPYLMLKEVA